VAKYQQLIPIFSLDIKFFSFRNELTTLAQILHGPLLLGLNPARPKSCLAEALLSQNPTRPNSCSSCSAKILLGKNSAWPKSCSTQFLLGQNPARVPCS